MTRVDADDSPAPYRDVLRVGEYRALYLADALSVSGDQVTRVAVGALIFARSDSTLLLAAAFAVGYLPWLLGGPVLASLADRLPRRRVMVACDFGRAVLISLLLIPGLPMPALLVLLFAAGLLAAPFEAARAATVPDILPGDLYVTGTALLQVLFQVGQVAGLLWAGAVVALLGPQRAILFDVATFLLSAAIIRLSLAAREVPPRDEPQSSGLLGDTVVGIRLVFRDKMLRSLVLLCWLGAAFLVVPEGLAIAEATRSGGGPVAYGALLAVVPAGVALGALLYARLLGPARRLRLMLPVCLAGFLPLLATPLSPSLPVTGFLWFLSGASGCYQLAASAAFVQAVPSYARGRAFSVAQSGLLAGQALALLAAGALADVFPPRTVVGAAGAAGLLVVGLLALRWPRAHTIDLTDARAAQASSPH